MAGMNTSMRRTVMHNREFQSSNQGYLVDNASWQDEIKKRAERLAEWNAPVFEAGAEVAASNAVEKVVDFEPVVLDPKAAYEEAVERGRVEANALMDRMLEEAHVRAEAEAEEIRSAAQRKVERLKTEADVQIREVKDSAQKLGEQAGREQGLEAGKADGLVAGRAEGLREYDAKIRSWDDLLRSAAENRKQAISDLEDLLVELVGEALHKCLQRETQERPAIVVDLVRAVLQKAHDRVSLRIHLNPEDVERVNSVKSELKLSIGAGDLVLVPDGRVEKGGCLLETESGSVDARLGTLASQAQDALKSGT
jgi:flagellar assembly protein FliH